MRLRLLTIQSALVAILLIVEGVCSFRWLGINGSLVDESKVKDLRRYLCSSSPTASRNRLLDKEQKRICRRRIKLMKYVVIAAKLAKKECLRLTKYERWNCKAILEAPKFTRDLRVGTQQSAFLQALSTAALVFAVTQSCAADRVCNCGRQPSRSSLRRYERKHPGKNYQYGGCHDNIAFGVRFSKDFLDRRQVRQSKPASRRLVTLHNNDLGRKVVFKSLNDTCRCPSFQQCSTLICLNSLIVSFSKIAEEIHNLYKQARAVIIDKSKTDRKRVLRIKSNGKSKKKLRKVNPGHMVYIYKSRNFCHPDITDSYKYPGTKGRVCGQKLRSNITKIYEYNPAFPVRTNVCPHLCCGRGYIAINYMVIFNCECRFSYSNMVVFCRKCPVVAEKLICK